MPLHTHLMIFLDESKIVKVYKYACLQKQAPKNIKLRGGGGGGGHWPRIHNCLMGLELAFWTLRYFLIC